MGVEPTECTGGNRLSARIQWGIQPNEVAVGHLANNSAEKGTVDLLCAAERAWSKGCRFRIVLAGPEMPNFLRFWKSFRFGRQVTRLGVLSDEARRDFFAGIDVFALPSRTDSFGLVLLEAWANGKPNLVYRAGGPAELVRDGIDGLQARCGNVEELSGKLVELVEQATARSMMGKRGRQRIEHEFCWADKLEFARRVLHGQPRENESSPARITSSSPLTGVSG
jgi:glycosyltransferase involved in cell wall biosynthesis